MKNDSNLFFLCSLIEFIGRQQRQKRETVVLAFGEKTLRHIYKYADVLHCEPIEKTDYWTIGEVYERLIEDVCEDDLVKTLIDVYTTWIDGVISNYNSDFYYQPRDYISECYRAGNVI